MAKVTRAKLSWILKQRLPEKKRSMQQEVGDD